MAALPCSVRLVLMGACLRTYPTQFRPPRIPFATVWFHRQRTSQSRGLNSRLPEEHSLHRMNSWNQEHRTVPRRMTGASAKMTARSEDANAANDTLTRKRREAYPDSLGLFYGLFCMLRSQAGSWYRHREHCMVWS